MREKRIKETVFRRGSLDQRKLEKLQKYTREGKRWETGKSKRHWNFT